MYDARNTPARTQVSHYLRTGQKVEVFEPNSYKSEKGLSAATLKIIINKVFKQPERSFAWHYFTKSGSTFDIVKKGLLPFITRSRVFQNARDKFLEQEKRKLMREAAKFCVGSPEDFILGRKKSKKQFNKKFSVNKQPIDFTNEFFSLGNSNITMKISLNVKIDCILRSVSITGNIRYIIEDEFKDVLDLDDAILGNQEIILGTPFPMVARWSSNFSFFEKLR